MFSLMLKLCLAGQPCKEIRVADFYSAQASYMCSYNRDGMTEQAKKEKRVGTFECKSGLPESTVAALAALKFEICAPPTKRSAGECGTFPLADFYGKESAAPMCAQNADYLRPSLETAASSTGTKIKLDCHSI